MAIMLGISGFKQICTWFSSLRLSNEPQKSLYSIYHKQILCVCSRMCACKKDIVSMCVLVHPCVSQRTTCLIPEVLCLFIVFVNVV